MRNKFMQDTTVAEVIEKIEIIHEEKAIKIFEIYYFIWKGIKKSSFPKKSGNLKERISCRFEETSR